MRKYPKSVWNFSRLVEGGVSHRMPTSQEEKVRMRTRPEDPHPHREWGVSADVQPTSLSRSSRGKVFCGGEGIPELGRICEQRGLHLRKRKGQLSVPTVDGGPPCQHLPSHTVLLCCFVLFCFGWKLIHGAAWPGEGRGAPAGRSIFKMLPRMQCTPSDSRSLSHSILNSNLLEEEIWLTPFWLSVMLDRMLYHRAQVWPAGTAAALAGGDWQWTRQRHAYYPLQGEPLLSNHNVSALCISSCWFFKNEEMPKWQILLVL